MNKEYKRQVPFGTVWKGLVLSLLSLSFLLLGAANLQAVPVLLGNKVLAGQTLDDDAVKAVLLGKKITLGDTRVVIVIVKQSESQEAFLKDKAGMTTAQFQTYWRRLFMSGGGTAPKEFDTEAEALKYAADTKGAVVVADSAKAEGLVVLNGK
jgi:hypothetical protein